MILRIYAYKSRERITFCSRIRALQLNDAKVNATFARDNSLRADELKRWTEYVDREAGTQR